MLERSLAAHPQKINVNGLIVRTEVQSHATGICESCFETLIVYQCKLSQGPQLAEEFTTEIKSLDIGRAAVKAEDRGGPLPAHYTYLPDSFTKEGSLRCVAIAESNVVPAHHLRQNSSGKKYTFFPARTATETAIRSRVTSVGQWTLQRAWLVERFCVPGNGILQPEHFRRHHFV